MRATLRGNIKINQGDGVDSYNAVGDCGDGFDPPTSELRAALVTSIPQYAA
jgi:hypothetical protein